MFAETLDIIAFLEFVQLATFCIKWVCLSKYCNCTPIAPAVHCDLRLHLCCDFT